MGNRRQAAYHTYIHITWPEEGMGLRKDMREFLDKTKEKLKDYTIGGDAALVNFPDITLVCEAAEKAY